MIVNCLQRPQVPSPELKPTFYWSETQEFASDALKRLAMQVTQSCGIQWRIMLILSPAPPTPFPLTFHPFDKNLVFNIVWMVVCDSAMCHSQGFMQPNPRQGFNPNDMTVSLGKSKPLKMTKQNTQNSAEHVYQVIESLQSCPKIGQLKRHTETKMTSREVQLKKDLTKGLFQTHARAMAPACILHTASTSNSVIDPLSIVYKAFYQ